MPDIYDEALVDRKRLLEVAENNAKNKIVDAITPRIKELVESALIGKLNEELGDDDILLDIDVPADDVGSLEAPSPTSDIPILNPEPANQPEDLPVAATDVAGGEDAGITLPDADGKVTLDIDSLVGAQDADQFELTPESIRALSALVGTNVADLDMIESRIVILGQRLSSLNEASDVASKERVRQIKLECERLYGDIQASRDVLDEARASDVESKLETVYKGLMESYSAIGHVQSIASEMIALNRAAGGLKKQLTESRTIDRIKQVADLMQRVVKLHSATRDLYESLGGDDSVDPSVIRQVADNLGMLYTEMRNMVMKKDKQINEADELDVGADVAGGEGEAGVDADDYLVQLKLPASLDALAAGENVEVVSVEPATGDEADESGMDDFAGLDSMDDEAGDMPEAPADDVEMESDGMYEAKLRDDDIIEIDEAALVAEMKRMKQLREKKSDGKNVNTGGHGAAHFDAFGGGKPEGEKFVDGEDINAHDPVGGTFLEEGDDIEMDEADASSDADELEEQNVRSGKPARKNARDKQLAESLQQTRKELAEQKLFNTKLVALNRVLQIPGLKQSQKQSIVETLDKGRTVAEVKELYSKIVASLKKKPVQESVRNAPRGTASRTITSAAPSGDGESNPILERWQKMAFGDSGLIKG